MDETLAQLLVAEGFTNLEEVAYVEIDELAAIEGFDDDLARSCRAARRKRSTGASRIIASSARAGRRGCADRHALSDRGDAGHRSARRASRRSTTGRPGDDELVEKKRAEQRRRNDETKRPDPKGGILAEYGLSDRAGQEIIMAARAHWFADEEEAPAAESSGPEPRAWTAMTTRRRRIIRPDALCQHPHFRHGDPRAEGCDRRRCHRLAGAAAGQEPGAVQIVIEEVPTENYGAGGQLLADRDAAKGDVMRSLAMRPVR